MVNESDSFVLSGTVVVSNIYFYCLFIDRLSTETRETSLRNQIVCFPLSRWESWYRLWVATPFGGALAHTEMYSGLHSRYTFFYNLLLCAASRFCETSTVGKKENLLSMVSCSLLSATHWICFRWAFQDINPPFTSAAIRLITLDVVQ